ncbi:hypothetical protein BCR44DRAFT_25611 [Catenaria anguillulae PL171]|uniref:Ankyrin repeat-containing domain protein n=1 Tax=Catenaria anguillulae PL171 TaxID=765915 RepID=A0A1Y2HA52_9FUNG|nr:hypothetical protein BCR44DRAFT_25611 [Catenaria anguillulae PL171]
MDLSVCSTSAMDSAGRFNQVAVLEWWIQHYHCPSRFISEEALLDVARGGHLDVLQWVARTHLNGADFDSDAVVDVSATHGHLANLKWFAAVSHLDKDRFGPNQWLAVSRNGHVHVLEWAWSQRGIDLPAKLQPCIDGAAGNGHTTVLDWFFANAPRSGFRYSVEALDVAGRNGHVATLEWFLRSGLELKFTPLAVEGVPGRGAMSCRQYLSVLTGRMSHHRPPSDLVMLAAFGYPISLEQARALDACHFQDMFAAACRHGQVNVLVTFKNKLSRGWNRTLLHCEAIRGNALAVLQWFAIEDPDRWNPFHAYLDQALIDAASSGHAQVVHFVFVSRYLGKPVLDEQSRIPLHKCVVAACRHGRLSVFDLLRSHPWFSLCLDHFGSTLALTAAAVGGHIAVLDWWQSHQLPFPPCAAAIIDQVSMGETDNGWLVLEWWANKQPNSFVFTDVALWGAIKGNNRRVIQWWVRSGFVKGPLMLAALEDVR